MGERDKSRSGEFATKAQLWLSWCELTYGEILQSGRERDVAEVERRFVTILLLLDGVHQALIDAAKMSGRKEWANELDGMRASDPLLKYLWNARRSEANDALVKWIPAMKYLEFEVVYAEQARLIKWGAPDPHAATQRLFFKAFEVASMDELIAKSGTGYVPPLSKQHDAGIELRFSEDSLALRGFTIGRGRGAERVEAPDTHLGETLPPSATFAAQCAIAYYRSKLADVQSLRRKEGDAASSRHTVQP